MRFFQNTPMAIATVDKTGRIARSNARFASAFEGMLKGDDRSILTVVAERDRPALEAAIRKAAEGQGDIAPVEAALAGSNERWASFFVSAVEEEDRDGEAAIVYALETTAQRTLENRVYQQQKMESVGQLAGGIAHDFNNVLSAIMMATDFLLNAHKPTDPSFQDIMQIKQNANRAAALVRQLLAFSRKQTLRPQVLDLGETLSDLGMLLKRLIGEKVTLGVVHGRDLWPVKVDISQFEQVIVNLAVNARDAMPDGGKLTVRTANVPAGECAKFAYKGMPSADYVLVEVTDTGTGIPPDIIDKIFEPFFSTKEVGKGTGLGLSTVYGIVKQTGGFVYADSKPGNTAFRIFLPRHVPGAEEALTQIPAADAPAIAGAMSAADTMARAASADLTGHGIILLVEDEEGLRALNARGLASRGYTVLEASNGVEAIEVLEKQGSVDLVVSDVVMPEMDGPTLLKELRRRDPAVKIIFVSGYAEEAFSKNLPSQEAICVPGQALHAQATGRRSEKDAGRIIRFFRCRVSCRLAASRVFSNTRTCKRQGNTRPAAPGCGALEIGRLQHGAGRAAIDRGVIEVTSRGLVSTGASLACARRGQRQKRAAKKRSKRSRLSSA